MAKFTPDSARRIAQQTRRGEQTPRTRVKTPPPPRIVNGAQYCIVTTAIGAAVRASSSLGKGAGTIQKVSYDSSGNATYTGTGQTVPIYSGAVAATGVPIAVGRLVIVAPAFGRFHVIVDFC